MIYNNITSKHNNIQKIPVFILPIILMFCGCNEQRDSTKTIVEHYIENIST